MPRIGFSKESLEGPAQIAEGLYEFRLEGFEPKHSKSKNNVNLNPVLKVVNHAQHNGARVFDNLNTAAPWIIEAFCHALGVPLEVAADGSANMPGEFTGPEDNPEQWNYVGPLLGLVGKAMVKETEYNGKKNTRIDQWLCSVSGCQTKHPTGLAK